jgi:hypothetical protein
MESSVGVPFIEPVGISKIRNFAETPDKNDN